GSCFATQPEVRRSLLHQGGGQGIVRRGQRVRNRLAPPALRLVPARCSSVQERYQLWLRSVQLSAQGFAKQIMITVPQRGWPAPPPPTFAGWPAAKALR